MSNVLTYLLCFFPFLHMRGARSTNTGQNAPIINITNQSGQFHTQNSSTARKSSEYHKLVLTVVLFQMKICESYFENIFSVAVPWFQDKTYASLSNPIKIYIFSNFIYALTFYFKAIEIHTKSKIDKTTFLKMLTHVII